jgi:hypothetical protein
MAEQGAASTDEPAAGGGHATQSFDDPYIVAQSADAAVNAVPENSAYVVWTCNEASRRPHRSRTTIQALR